MTEVIAGPGLTTVETTGYLAGRSVPIVELSLDTYASCIDPQMISGLTGAPGEILTIDKTGSVCWKKAFESDKELREQYPALEESWGILMEALAEYQMVKKLVQDHDK